mmetsp:Transcript_25080/g.41624  ORF Transcript_25080/g.41624 Transcript_25080/m.41624 type:complete len:298 (-) Transcript_25080:242-1135(-)
MSDDVEYSVVDSEEEGESEWDDDHDAQQLYTQKSILWLCQEGLLPEARRRFEVLLMADNNNHAQLLKRQIFQVGNDGNYPLHEILMGGTSDTNAHALVVSILDFATEHHPQQCAAMLSRRPKSHLRTPLHWATWAGGNVDIELVQKLVRAYPEALILRDKPDKGRRTPLEIFDRYHLQINHLQTAAVSAYLKKAMQSWTRHRLRLTVHLAAHHYFGNNDNDNDNDTDNNLTPFDKSSGRNGIKPRPWFCLSVLGFLLQREMKPLVLHILGFVGKDAKVLDHHRSKKRATKKTKRKRK